MRTFLTAGLILATSSLAWCQAPQTPPTPTPVGPPRTAEAAKETSIELTPSITKHTLMLNGKPLAYTATAAQIPIRNDAGETECRMFYAAYTKDDADPDTRPVTFAFNGGPGSATLWLHMGGLGPKRAPMNDDGSLPRPPYAAVDNSETWLDFTDVVFVDAPDTGFSRLARRDLGPKFFGVDEDIAAFTAFVQGWLKAHKRWRSPIFIAGESYGGIRGSGLCANLFEEGVAVNGFISISGTNSYLTLNNMRGNDATFIGFLPSLAATAWYHNKVSHAKYNAVGPFVDAVRKWTDQVYGPALMRGDSLSASEKDAVATQLAEYTGLTKKYCLGANLKVSPFAFFRELLRDDGLTVGRYDSRLVGKEETRSGGGSSGDPSDEAVTPPFISALNDYLVRDLGIKTEMEYRRSANTGAWRQRGGTSETASDLSRVLLRNPHLRVLYCCGYYDLACPLNATHFMLNHMGLDSETRGHVSFAYYPAGHMMYIEKSSRQKLHDDAAKFVRDTLALPR